MIEEYFTVIILGIIFGAGVLGGTTNYLLLIGKDQKESKSILFFRSLLVSVCASLTVPLFLQILSNNILDTHSIKTCLVFASFCVLAAFFSKRFLEDVYAKIEKQVTSEVEKKLDDKVEDIRQENDTRLTDVTKGIIKKVDDLEESIESFEGKDEFADNKLSHIIGDDFKINEIKLKKVMDAFVKNEYTYRTPRGIAKEVEMPLDEVQSLLDYLEHMGLVRIKEVIRGKQPGKFYSLLKYPIKIYSASYGIPGKTVDVTEKMKYFVANDILKGPVSPANLGVVDPSPGQMKILKVHCRIYGMEHELPFADGHEFDLRHGSSEFDKSQDSF